MSYYGQPPQLVARTSYSDLGAQSYDNYLQAGGSPCTSSQYYDPNTATCKSSDSSSGGVWGTVKDIGSGLLSIFGKSQTPAPQQTGTPGWVWPVAIGGVGLVAILLLRRPRQNPARRRKHHRRRHRRARRSRR